MLMETQSCSNSQRKQDQKHDLKEFGVKARMISRENTLSRRFSASHVSSFRDDPTGKSFRTVSSTTSSPGYSTKEEIDPSTYSFTTALKALQVRSINTWEYLSAEGLALNSKWNEAERYICNPLSGEVPMECLSSKTLMNGGSFRNRITMSAPLIHHSSRIQLHKLTNVHPIQDEHEAKENKNEESRLITTTTMTMMEVKPEIGIESSVSESSPSPTSTPSIQERPMKFDLNLDSSTSSSKSESESKLKLEFKEEDAGEKKKQKKMMKMKGRDMVACAQGKRLVAVCPSTSGQEKIINYSILIRFS